jgi:hypothetical protein
VNRKERPGGNCYFSTRRQDGRKEKFLPYPVCVPNPSASFALTRISQTAEHVGV